QDDADDSCRTTSERDDNAQHEYNAQDSAQGVECERIAEHHTVVAPRSVQLVRGQEVREVVSDGRDRDGECNGTPPRGSQYPRRKEQQSGNERNRGRGSPRRATGRRASQAAPERARDRHGSSSHDERSLHSALLVYHAYELVRARGRVERDSPVSTDGDVQVHVEFVNRERVPEEI